MSSPIQSTDIPNFQYIFSDFTQKRSAHKLKHQRNSIAAVIKRAAKALGQRGSLFRYGEGTVSTSIASRRQRYHSLQRSAKWHHSGPSAVMSARIAACAGHFSRSCILLCN